MPSKEQKLIKISGIILFVAVIMLEGGCKRKGIVAHNGTKDIISFKSIQGITYTEVARRMKNGLSFNEYGYQLEPQWKMSSYQMILPASIVLLKSSSSIFR